MPCPFPGKDPYLEGSGRWKDFHSRFIQDVHLFELDLLVAGRRLPLRDPLPPGDYFALVSRADRRFDCDVYAWQATQPLPKLPVPLKAPDPDIVVDLGKVFAMAYERGRYARSLNYDELPKIGLSSEARQRFLEMAKPRMGA